MMSAANDGVSDGAAGGAMGGGLAGVAIGGSVLQPARTPKIAADNNNDRHNGDRIFETMWIILLEALAAGCLFVLIVWWTMFSGRSKGERRGDDDEPS